MNIEHDTTGKRFFIASNGTTAYLEYIQTGATFEVIHTKVPIELSGKGVAGQLVQYAFEYAQNRGLLFVPSCLYAQSWLDKNHFNKSPNEL